MEKNFLALGLTLSLLLIPSILSAQVSPATGCEISNDLSGYGDICPDKDKSCDFDDDDEPECAVCCVMNGIITVKNWVFSAAMVVSALMVIFGGFTLATAGGDPSKVNSGRNYILYAIIGFTVALLSTAIPALAQGLLGLSFPVAPVAPGP